jgi:hypothetical protein
VLVRGEEYLVVAPNSRIRVADPAKAGGLTQIIENFGNVIYKIKKMTMPHFAVETPFLAAVVKGTTFSVTVTEKGASVQVIEGRVEVATRDGGASFLVLPGDIGSVNANAPGSLNVQGRETKTINSPTPAVAAAAVTASVQENAVAPADQVQLSGVIEAPVSEGSVELGAMSDGMVKGDSALIAMASTTKTAIASVQTPAVVETVQNVVTGNAVAADVVPVALPPVVADLPPAPVVDPIEVVALPPTPAPPVVAALPPAPAVEPVEVVALPPTPAPAPPAVVAAPTPPPPAMVGAPALQPIVAALPAPVNNSGNGNAFGQNGSGNGNNGNGNNANGQGNNNGQGQNNNHQDD